MRYGNTLTMTTSNGIIKSEQEVYANFATIKRTTIYTEIIRISDDSKILAEFLKLLDKRKTGEYGDIAIQVITDQKTGQARIEKSWTITDLH